MSLLCHLDEYLGDDICFRQRHRFWTRIYVWDNSLTSVGFPTSSEFSVASPPACPHKTSPPPGCSSRDVVKSYSSWCILLKCCCCGRASKSFPGESTSQPCMSAWPCWCGVSLQGPADTKASQGAQPRTFPTHPGLLPGA